MDAQKFGSFVARCRKEKNMTQADLAAKINVTDKAVSRWERGLGFPDINTIEPLAEALDLSVLEIMKSEKLNEVSETESSVVSDVIEIAKSQQERERKRIFLICGIVAVPVLYILYLDLWASVTGIGTILMSTMVFLPCIGIVGGIVLLLFGIWRKIHHQSCKQTFFAAACFLMIPVIIAIILFLLVVIGGAFPVPN
ncbi:MAG: helix-turn-helix domain-containing protein [Clostridiales bacterium]|nr:helix-turn-helix domain-containing protein [Clostridiales bacterium]